jgi:hypothetical protein
MRLPQLQINPTSRIASALHILYLLLLPLLVLGLVRSDFTSGAVLVVILSKWRMFAVKPRYWMANVRANSVDIIVGLSVISFMANSAELSTSLIWAATYAFWLVVIKPKSSPLWVGLQALIAQGVGLVATFNNFSTWHQVYLVVVAWLICFSAARHLFTTYDDGSNRPLAHLWAIFAAQMALILGKWHIVYLGVVPQVALLLSVIGYTLALGYYLHNAHSSLSAGVRKQLIVFSVAIVVLILLFSNWQPDAF